MVKISGGEALARRLAEISANVTTAASVHIGILDGSTYPDGTSVALVATVQEFGAPSRGIPARAAIRGMIADKSAEWPAAIGALLVAHDYNAETALALTGEAIAGQWRAAYAAFSGVPLSPVTIARKGHSKQLVDSALLLRSPTYEVRR